MTHYTTLGVERDFTPEDLKKAYRKLSMIYHPDRPTGDEEEFKKIKEAYEVLSDSNERAHYDNSLADGSNVKTKTEFRGQESTDIYSNIFNKRKDRESPVRGRNRNAETKVTFAEAAAGVTKDILIPIITTCGNCLGKGVISTDEQQTCNTCKGTKKIVSKVTNPFGHTAETTRRCPDCRDVTEEVIPCTACEGEGTLNDSVLAPISIRPGIANGDRVRLQGWGEDGTNGGDPGDLIVTVQVEEDDQYIREGNNLIKVLDVNFSELVSGGQYTIDLLGESVSFNILKGTQPGAQIRIRNKGLKGPSDGKHGDLLIKLNLLIPEDEDGSIAKELKRLGV